MLWGLLRSSSYNSKTKVYKCYMISRLLLWTDATSANLIFHPIPLQTLVESVWFLLIYLHDYSKLLNGMSDVPLIILYRIFTFTNWCHFSQFRLPPLTKHTQEYNVLCQNILKMRLYYLLRFCVCTKFSRIQRL